MKEVSCVVMETVFAGLLEKKISPSILCSGIPYDLNYLRNKNERIEWNVYCRIMSNLKSVWNEKDFENLGSHVGRTRSWTPHIIAGKLLFSTTEMYEWWSSPSNHGGGKQLFSCVIPSVKRLGKNHLRITLAIEEGYQDCREFFIVTKTGLAFIPTIYGKEPASVDMHWIERGAAYDIHYTEAGGALSWLRKFFTWPSNARTAARELQEANKILVDRYQQLEEAKAQVLQQTAALEASYRARQGLQEEFSRRLIEQTDAARYRLASELHDSLGQNLLVVGFELQQFLSDQHVSHDELQRIAALVQESVETVREISSDLHPHQLERLGVRAAIEALVERISHSTGLSLTCTCDPIVDRLASESAIHLYRIVQEAFANVARHARAHRAGIDVREAPDSPNMMDVAINDDGCGFVVHEDGLDHPGASSSTTRGGFGLASMRERARIIGATLRIESSLATGTCIRLRVPLPSGG
jgi:signal transduction histidine kinase